jgi:quercetin dioxygenase-like cupin family protein
VYTHIYSLHSSVHSKEEAMQIVNLREQELVSNFEGHHVVFPVSSATGNAATATVYMEFEPGAELPEHRDSAEELLVVLEGTVEAHVDGATVTMREGDLTVVPAMAAHGVRNTGDRRARVLGFFGGATNVATFTDPQGPQAWRVFVVGAPIPMAAPLEEPALV